MTRTPHVEHDDFQQLLRGKLDALNEAAITQHLDECPTCCEQLQLAAGSPQWWDGFASHLRQAGTRQAVAPSPLVTLLLAPSDVPDMLGRLGVYEVAELLGVGGMGVVFKARDAVLDRWVALKVLSPQLALNDTARRRFEREARAAAAIVHPNVVAILHVDAQHAPPYFVMEWIAGESLQQRLNRVGRLPVSEVIAIGRQIALGLAVAEERGIVHRDIKPSNIMLADNGNRVALTDFGLALVATEASLTHSGLIAGTPQFMSPEQAAGAKVDHRSDLFSLGSVLYALLSGVAPFRAEQPLAVLRQITTDSAPALHEIDPEIPEMLIELINRLHKKDPVRRIQSAREVAIRLEFASRLSFAQAARPPASTLRRGVKKSPQLYRWLNAFGAVLVLLGVLQAVMQQVAHSPPDTAPTSEADNVSSVVAGSRDFADAPSEASLSEVITTAAKKNSGEPPELRAKVAPLPALSDEELARLDLSGTWLMTFPTGITDSIRIVSRGRQRWLIVSSTNMSGMYRRERDELIIEVPQTRGLTEFRWQISETNMLRLTHAPQPPKVPVNLIGTRLNRR